MINTPQTTTRLINRRRKNSQSGLSLIETLLYSALLVLLLSVIMSVLVMIVKSYQHVNTVKEIQTAAMTTIDRVTQEIHRADSISPETTATNLVLNTTNDFGQVEKMEFRLEADGKIYLIENGVSKGALMPSDVSVSSLIFQTIYATNNQGVRITLSLSSGLGDNQREETFYTTVALRQSSL